MSSVAEQIAKATWQRLEQARRHDVRLGEETLTDLLALEWARSDEDYYRLFQTTKADEAIHGTDLELRIRVGQSDAIVVAIQAKKLNRSTERYDSLNTFVGKTANRQIDVLEDYARQIQATPLYLLYNHAQVLDAATYWHCGRDVDEQQLGCTLTPSSTIRDVISWPRGRRSFHWIHSRPCAIPWRCLFECPRGLQPNAKCTREKGTSRSLKEVVDVGYAQQNAWPNRLWNRSSDTRLSMNDLTELHGGREVRLSDEPTAAPPRLPGDISEQRSDLPMTDSSTSRPLEASQPLLTPRHILLIDPEGRSSV